MKEQDPMSDLETRLVKLDGILAKLEQVKLAETVKSLEARLRELEAARPSEPTPPPPPPPTIGPTLKAALAGAVAAVVPISTVLYGIMEQQRQRLATEHEIVKAHLDDALASDAADVYDLEHLRHLRFLKSLAPEGAKPDPDDLKTNLGTWAQLEYRLKMRQIEQASKNLGEDINQRRVEIAWLEMNLRIDWGWYEQEFAKWVKTEQQPDEELVAAITKGLHQRQANIDDKHEELEAWEHDWDQLAIAREQGQSSLTPLLDPTDTLARKCDATSATTDRQRKDRLAACVLEGRFYYRYALEGGEEHPNYEIWINAANDRFERACDESWAEGCRHLADSYRRKHVRDPLRLAKLEPQYVTELALVMKAHGLGDPAASNALGWYYLEAEGVEKDEQRAFDLFRLSCRQGVLNGCDSLGTWYARSATKQSGSTAEESKSLAAEWFNFACDGGEVRGCVNAINLKLNTPPSAFELPTASLSVAPEQKP
jgi:TPR repeat protein